MICIVSLLIAFGGISSAAVSILGGVRGGLAIGARMTEPLNNQPKLNLCGELELATGDQPLLLSVGGQYPLGKINYRYPVSMGFGLIAQGGNKAEAGLYANFLFENMFEIQPLFLEAGIDVVGSGRAVIQFGYKI